MPIRTDPDSRYAIKDFAGDAPDSSFELEKTKRRCSPTLPTSSAFTSDTAIESQLDVHTDCQANASSTNKQELRRPSATRNDGNLKVVRLTLGGKSHKVKVPTPRTSFRLETVQRGAVEATIDDANRRHVKKPQVNPLMPGIARDVEVRTSPVSACLEPPRRVTIDAPMMGNSKQEQTRKLQGSGDGTPRALPRAVRLEPPRRATIDAPLMDDSRQEQTRKSLANSLMPGFSKDIEAGTGFDIQATSPSSVQCGTPRRVEFDNLVNDSEPEHRRKPQENSLMPEVVNDLEAGTGSDIRRTHLQPLRRATVETPVRDANLRHRRQPRAQTTMSGDADVVEVSDFQEVSSLPRRRSRNPPSPKVHLQPVDNPWKKVHEERCIDCGKLYGHVAADAKFCLNCGGCRVGSQPFNDLFEALAHSRVTMRRADLKSFIFKVEVLLPQVMHLRKVSARRHSLDTTVAFDETLENQVENQVETGCKYTQGITREFFIEFMWRVAENLQLTCRSLLEVLLGRAVVVEEPSAHLGGQKADLPWLRHFNSTSCQHCGSNLISNSNFCCNCGLEHTPRARRGADSFQFFKGTRDVLMGRKTENDPMGEQVFADLVRLSHAHHIPLDDVRKCWKDFFSLGVNKDNLLPRESFVAAVRDRRTLPQDTDLQINSFGDELIMGASRLGEHVDFEAFLQWSL